MSGPAIFRAPIWDAPTIPNQCLHRQPLEFSTFNFFRNFKICHLQESNLQTTLGNKNDQSGMLTLNTLHVKYSFKT